MGMPSSDGSWIISTLIAGGTFVLTVLTAVWTGAWRAGALKAEHDKKVLDLAAELREETNNKFEAARAERTREIKEEGRLYGDTITALRTRINEVDIQRTKDINDLAFWVRDNMVSKPDFQNMVNSFNRGLDAVREDIKEVGAKIDRFTQGFERDRDAHR